MEIYLPFFVAACHHTFCSYPQMMMLSSHPAASRQRQDGIMMSFVLPWLSRAKCLNKLFLCMSRCLPFSCSVKAESICHSMLPLHGMRNFTDDSEFIKAFYVNGRNFSWTLSWRSKLASGNCRVVCTAKWFDFLWSLKTFEIAFPLTGCNRKSCSRRLQVEHSGTIHKGLHLLSIFQITQFPPKLTVTPEEMKPMTFTWKFNNF